MVKEAEERKANAPDPDLPLGHRLMPEQERVQTLDKLKQSTSLHVHFVEFCAYSELVS